MTFEEWYKDSSGLYPLALPKKQLSEAFQAGQAESRELAERMRRLSDAYQAGQADARELAERMRRLIVPICEFESGIKVNSTFDEPYAAKRAREAIVEIDKFLGKGGV